MSLDYQLEKITGYKELCWVPNPEGEGVIMNPVTQNLIFSTISVGIGEITVLNYEEFYFRNNIMERLIDIPRNNRLTVQDVIDHIGLSTNVSFETRAKWLKRHIDYEWRDMQYAFRKLKASSN